MSYRVIQWKLVAFSILNVNLNCISIFNCIDLDFYFILFTNLFYFKGDFYIGLSSKLPFLEVPFFLVLICIYSFLLE